ncbi:MAG TPA: DUF2834 domain-containing protein [Campylobacterales bacterium]|nr:DUF2834 domain-containing protein [Campylobacterales bacterium]
MTRKNMYLLLAFLGILLPYSLFLPWLLKHGLDFQLFFQELFINDIAGTGGLDILAVTIAIVVFIIFEGKRLAVKKFWIPALGTIMIGVGFGLPLFLYMRERYLYDT